MDIPITTRSRALILRYEHDRPVDESIARDTLKQSGTEGDRDVASMVLHPFDPSSRIRDQREQDWIWAFHENERFADALLKKERECGPDLPIHLFGCAPLVLMLHLGWCLSRRPLSVYQQSPLDGAWSLGHTRAQPPTTEDFFQIEGLPPMRQGGRGYVALIIEVTKPIREIALAEFQARHPSELLATVCLRPARGTGKTSVQSQGDISRAVEQLRDVLDTLHERVDGATSVLMAMDCPASLATALGTAINPNTQHPLWLHHFNPDHPEQRRYLPVYQIRHQRRRTSAPAKDLSNEQWKDVLEVLDNVRLVHERLVKWLEQPEQNPCITRLGGRVLLESSINNTPATETAPIFRYLNGRWTFPIELLLGFQSLRQRLNSQEDWDECVRLFLLHEAYHVQQGGPNSYTYRGSGRTGWVLEEVDYDADVVAMEVALALRQGNGDGGPRGQAPAQALEAIVWNAVETVRSFEPERPVRELSERRLRRYLIWLFHACRLSTLRSQKAVDVRLDRVVIEIAGLPTVPDIHETYSQQSVRLDELGKNDSLSLAIYFRRKLTRDMDAVWIRELLQAICSWDDLRPEKARDKARLLFETLFSRHPALTLSTESSVLAIPEGAPPRSKRRR